MMNTYFCNVNNKYLIKSDFESAIQAEHFFLNNFECVWSCTAFDSDQTQTDTFYGWLHYLNFISIDEFSNLECEFAASMANMKSAMQAKIDIMQEIQDLKRQLEEVEDGLKNALNHNAQMQEKTGYRKEW